MSCLICMVFVADLIASRLIFFMSNVASGIPVTLF
jgi:hypothetical protein